MRRPVLLAVAIACTFGVLGAYLGLTSSSGDTPSARIAYVSGPGHLVWLADDDGTNRRALGPGEAPLLAPDGGTVAASQPGPQGSALVLYSASGGPSRRFFDATKVNAAPQAFSPDSRYLAVALSSSSPDSTSAAGLAIIDLETGRSETIARGQISGASFAPQGPDQLVYAMSRSASISSRVNLYVSGVDGSARRQLTHDGRSLNPVWGPSAIAFDRERLRRHDAPVYEIWLIAPDGSGMQHLTRVRVRTLENGLVPIAFSADGRRLLARYEGLDTSQTWAIAIGAPWTRQLKITGESVNAGGISRDGGTVLVDRGGYLSPPEQGTVEVVPFYGGRATVIVPHGTDPTWNR
jgi:hypothetical protein